MIRSLSGKHPVLGKGVFVAETAAIIGDVEIGDESSVWYGTVIRGDDMPIHAIPARRNAPSVSSESVIEETGTAAAAAVSSAIRATGHPPMNASVR